MDDHALAPRRAGRGGADLEQHRRRRLPSHVEPMVGAHVGRVDAIRVGGGGDVRHPPVGMEEIALLPHLMLAGEDHAAAGEAAAMDELDMAEVHQIVGADIDNWPPSASGR